MSESSDQLDFLQKLVGTTPGSGGRVQAGAIDSLTQMTWEDHCRAVEAEMRAMHEAGSDPFGNDELRRLGWRRG